MMSKRIRGIELNERDLVGRQSLSILCVRREGGIFGGEISQSLLGDGHGKWFTENHFGVILKGGN
jgi:hypothetical protein